MAKYSGMSAVQATSKAIGDRAEEQLRQITLKQNEYYKSIEAWNYPEDSYERHMWEIFKDSYEYRKYIKED